MKNGDTDDDYCEKSETRRTMVQNMQDKDKSESREKSEQTR